MANSVDVLEAIRRACDSDALPYEVHAAVAELIEADKEYDEAWRDMAGRTHTAARRERAGLRRAAAIARVQGVKS